MNVLPAASATEESIKFTLNFCASLKQQLNSTMAAEDDYPAVHDDERN
jgi:hypothetical protein